MMASADCYVLPNCSQLATHTLAHTHTLAQHFLPVCHHRVSNSLRFASLTSPSQSLCTAAGRGSRHTLSHTHTLLCSTPIFFGRGETRSKQKQDSTAFFIFSNGGLLQKSARRFRDFSASAQSCSKKIREYRRCKRNMHNSTCQPINRHPKSGKTEEGNLDLCGGFWKRANVQCSSCLFFFLDGRRQEQRQGLLPVLP